MIEYLRPVRRLLREFIELPKNYKKILEDADDWVDDRSSPEDLFNQLCDGVFLNQRKQVSDAFREVLGEPIGEKELFHVVCRRSVYRLGRREKLRKRALGGKLKSSRVKSSEPRWLEIQGRFDVSKLSPETKYEVKFVVMMKDSKGKHIPVDVRLILPDGSRQEHKENLGQKPELEWIEIHAGKFTTSSTVEKGEIEFTLYQFEGELTTRKHLILSHAVIRNSSTYSYTIDVPHQYYNRHGIIPW